jgi:uncharacterized protein YgbK (DUF1537 family)
MGTRRHEVIADDLTGATEIAAIGSRHGIPSAVVRGSATPASAAQLIVRDADTRLDPPAMAAEKTARLARGLRDVGARNVFKKTDSVLRGPVVAELEALADTLEFRRVILAPANPSLGRTIVDGEYFIRGVPLHETAFASDPHHPARSPRVLDLLGPSRALPVVLARPTDDLPARGIIVAEAASLEDTRAWAQRLDAKTLPAGGGDFFDAWLGDESAVSPPSDNAKPPRESLRPTLFVMGSVAPASRQLRELARAAGIQLLAMPDGVENSAIFARWCDATIDALTRTHIAMIVAARPPADDPRWIRETLAALVSHARTRAAFRHLVVEGGATAAAVLDALGWSQLELIHEWARGVASLRPLDAPEILVTFKPGSYAWPAAIRELLAPTA